MNNTTNKQDKKLNWGLLGAGTIAREMAAALHEVNGEVYGVSASRPESAKRFAMESGVKQAYQSPEAMLADPEIDIVYIATPHNLHDRYIRMSLEAGKHVFCEKAITVNSRQLEACAALAAEKGLILSDGTTLLHNPLYRKLRDMIDEGTIGKVKMIQVNFGSCKEYDVNNRFFSKELAGGALLDIGVYAVSFARWFMNSRPDVVLTTANYFETGVDETSGIILKNPDGEMAVIALTMRAKQPKRGVIAGEKGYIEIENYPRADKAAIVYTADGHRETVEAGNTADALQYEVRDMEDYVRKGDGGQNLTLVRDVMSVLTSIRDQWGMKYPFE
ncbi:MAG: Gfo/Idh/MocA family protein [Eubacteriaceae bacterium]|jgi:predicted dehydrogenase